VGKRRFVAWRLVMNRLTRACPFHDEEPPFKMTLVRRARPDHGRETFSAAVVCATQASACAESQPACHSCHRYLWSGDGAATERPMASRSPFRCRASTCALAATAGQHKSLRHVSTDKLCGPPYAKTGRCGRESCREAKNCPGKHRIDGLGSTFRQPLGGRHGRGGVPRHPDFRVPDRDGCRTGRQA